MNEPEVARASAKPAPETVVIEEDAALIAAELMPVAVFLGWTWAEVRPDREIDGAS